MHATLRNVVAAFLLLGLAGCNDQANTQDGAGGSTGGFGGSPAAGSAAPMAGVGAGAAAGTMAGAGAGAVGGMIAGAGGVGAPPGGMGGTPPAMDSGSGGAGGDEPDGGGDAMVPLEIPEPVAEPYVWGFGLGVTDLEAAVDFYTSVMEMTVEKEVMRDDRSETILYATEAARGARLVLMKFNDGRETRKITTKLVWQASNASAVNSAASSHPDYVSRISFPVYQFDGPDTYIQEVAGIFDTEGGDIEVPYLIAMGFSVSDLTASRSFYREELGMTEESLGAFPVTDATGSATITEYSERHATGSGIVLQDWAPDRNSKDNPVKIVMFVPDAQATADAIVGAGGSIVAPAERTAVYDNRLLIVTKDLDGYMIELVQ